MTITKEAVIKAVHRGTTTANSRFEEWSKGSWVSDYGIEGFMVAHIAAALRKKQDKGESLLLEATFKEIREYSGADRRPGRPRKVFKDGNRADITLLNQDGRTVRIIEVKRSWDKTTCFRDIRRLLALLEACARQRSGSLKYGFLALPIVETAKTRSEVRDKIDAKVKKIKRDVRTEFQEEFEMKFRVKPHLGDISWYPKHYREKYGDEKEYALAGFCLTFSNKATG